LTFCYWLRKKWCCREIGKCYGREMHVDRPKIMRISGQPSTIKIMMDQKQLENVA
jgi:hypothetical protein